MTPTRRGLVDEGRRLRAQEGRMRRRRRKKRRGQVDEGRSAEVSRCALDERPRSAAPQAALLCPPCSLKTC